MPCNQFGAQEPGTDQEILAFVTENYGEPFQLLSKVDVNGDNAAPLYQLLRSALPREDGVGDLTWNFTKFLIARDGSVFKRYAPQTDPAAISADIESLLAAE